MPRTPRPLLDGAIYHVFNRGNGRMDLFAEESDYRFFLKKLHEAKIKFGVTLNHYCLMSNHYHLLVQIVKGENLSRFMHYLQMNYAHYFGKKYNFSGHVFGQRYRSPIIPKESYYLQCGRYIERNPVKAGLAGKAEDYPYSSAKFYSLGRADALITPNIYYEGLGRTESERQTTYKEFLEMEDPYAEIISEALEKN